MLRFFRHIRKKLIEEDNIRKYLLYAIGEILLVVIGILIALQVNTWNQQRIENIKVKTALESLKQEIISDSFLINKELEASLEIQIQARILNDKIRLLEVTLDTLIHIARYEFNARWVSHINYNTANYENLKNSGTFELLSDSLKQQITFFYNSQEYWAGSAQRVFNQYQERFDDYTKSYSFASTGIEGTYLDDVIWSDIDPKHFGIRLLYLVSSRRIMWDAYVQELEEVLALSDELIRTLDNSIQDLD